MCPSVRPLRAPLQAFRELRSARVDRGGTAPRISYRLRSLARFLEAGRACADEITPMALLLLVLHAEQGRV